MLIDMMRPEARVADVVRIVAAQYGPVKASRPNLLHILDDGKLHLQVVRNPFKLEAAAHTVAVFDPPSAIWFFVVLEPGRQSKQDMARIVMNELSIAVWLMQEQKGVA